MVCVPLLLLIAFRGDRYLCVAPSAPGEDVTYSVQYQVSCNASGPQVVVAGDLNGDGLVDVAVALSLADQLVWWSNRNGSDATLFSGAAMVLDQTLGGIEDIVLSDVNNDGLTGVGCCPSCAFAFPLTVYLCRMSSHLSPRTRRESQCRGVAVSVCCVPLPLLLQTC